jgi:hypothetical protein
MPLTIGFAAKSTGPPSVLVVERRSLANCLTKRVDLLGTARGDRVLLRSEVAHLGSRLDLDTVPTPDLRGAWSARLDALRIERANAARASMMST